MPYPRIKIIGAGLAGSEAALQLASAGLSIDLYEMRPTVTTPAHQTSKPAELVCSNSLKGTGLTSAHGLFKHELQTMGSKLIPLAYEARVPAGESLTVDRDIFSKLVEKHLTQHPLITWHNEEVTELKPEEYTLIATGPLTSPKLCDPLFKLTGKKGLAFFDSIAPVVDGDSIDFNFAYKKNRWEKGDTDDFINCPLNREEYYQFVEDLVAADTVELKPFEKGQLFEGCLPIEEMARRGKETLRFGPMRPIGLRHPETGETPHAVIQLRAENQHKTLYNMVGCQTRLKWGTQKEIFAKIKALAGATYARMGSMHRNTFIDSPRYLTKGLRLKDSNIFFAGQITGAEGYTEAIGTGLYTSSMMYAELLGDSSFDWPAHSCLGSLTKHLLFPNEEFQPMNFNFGLLPPLHDVPKKQRKEAHLNHCEESLNNFKLPWAKEAQVLSN